MRPGCQETAAPRKLGLQSNYYWYNVDLHEKILLSNGIWKNGSHWDFYSKPSHEMNLGGGFLVEETSKRLVSESFLLSQLLPQ